MAAPGWFRAGGPSRLTTWPLTRLETLSGSAARIPGREPRPSARSVSPHSWRRVFRLIRTV